MAELGRVELDAGDFALPPPRLVVGAEYAVPEEVPDGVAEVGALGEVGELGLEQVLEVARVRCHHAVEVAHRRTLERKRPVPAVEHIGDPLVHVGPKRQSQRRQHPQERPHGKPIKLLLPDIIDNRNMLISLS